MNQKIFIFPLREQLKNNKQNFLEEKCNIILNNGNELFITFNPSSYFTPHSRNLNNNNGTISLNDNNLNNQIIIKNLDLKILICNNIKGVIIKPEMLILYYKLGENFMALNDSEFFSFNKQVYNNLNINVNSNNTSGLNSEKRSTCLNKKKYNSNRSSKNNLNELKPINLYYKICNYTQKVIIDIYQNNIEKIIFNISISCSVYMLKFLILQKLKLNNLDLIKNHKIYGLGFFDSENINFINKEMTNKKFNDDNLIYDIMIYYMEPSKIGNKYLNLILIENSPEKCFIGLGFKFNVMNTLKKIQNYESNAPSYRNVSDGLNFFIYCLNKECLIYNNYFTVNKGYGSFNIFDILNDINCPLCNCKYFSLRNLGMINSKWNFKDFLKGVKKSKINGEGITLDNDKLYIIKEIIFENQFESLFLEVEYYQIKIPIVSSNNNKTSKNSYQSSINNIESSLIQSSSEISESDLNSIYLEQKYLKNDGKLSFKPIFEIEDGKEFTFQKNENEEENKIKDNILNENNNIDNNNSVQKSGKSLKKNEKTNIIKKDECEIKIESKKESCCLTCSHFTNNSCYLW